MSINEFTQRMDIGRLRSKQEIYVPDDILHAVLTENDDKLIVHGYEFEIKSKFHRHESVTIELLYDLFKDLSVRIGNIEHLLEKK